MSALPDNMTVVEIQKPGGPEVLGTAKRPVPKPGVGELLVKVAAAGINGADLLQREGRYPLPPGITDILGLEVSGSVVAAGEGTSRFKVGDPVCALVVGG
ncbi:MAG: alcohol dehydrogenase catalytic domain-containing protein, partial [Alphaproteobacteria bacterium]|nr:alcohol dehydrogenase catalytic domain-containing protein [Alphaproteobacteria bacterium]